MGGETFLTLPNFVLWGPTHLCSFSGSWMSLQQISSTSQSVRQSLSLHEDCTPWVFGVGLASANEMYAEVINATFYRRPPRADAQWPCSFPSSTATGNVPGRPALSRMTLDAPADRQ